MNQGSRFEDNLLNTGKFSYGFATKSNILDDDEIAGSHVLQSGQLNRIDQASAPKFNKSQEKSQMGLPDQQFVERQTSKASNVKGSSLDQSNSESHSTPNYGVAQARRDQRQDLKHNSQQELQIRKPKCLKHGLEISFMCCVSQWHCEPLCVDCIPSHTDQHNKQKNQGNFQKFDQVKQECLDKCFQLREMLQQHKGKIKEEIDRPYLDANMSQLKKWRQSVILLFEQYFDQIEQEYQEKLLINNSNLNKKLQEIVQEVDKVLGDLQTHEKDIESLNAFSKGISNTFRLNVDDFVRDLDEEVDRVKLSQKPNETLKINQPLVQYLHDNIGRLITFEQVKEREEIKKAPKQLVKLKSKNCPECGSEMSYVSKFKKHMECSNCSKVKRPNSRSKFI